MRRLAVVRPYGLDTPLEVSELLPPTAHYPQLTDEHLQSYEEALDACTKRRTPHDQALRNEACSVHCCPRPKISAGTMLSCRCTLAVQHQYTKSITPPNPNLTFWPKVSGTKRLVARQDGRVSERDGLAAHGTLCARHGTARHGTVHTHSWSTHIGSLDAFHPGSSGMCNAQQQNTDGHHVTAHTLHAPVGHTGRTARS